MRECIMYVVDVVGRSEAVLAVYPLSPHLSIVSVSVSVARRGHQDVTPCDM